MCAGEKKKEILKSWAHQQDHCLYWPPSQMKFVLSVYTCDTDTKQVLRGADIKAITQGARADGTAATHTSCSPPQDSIMYSTVLCYKHNLAAYDAKQLLLLRSYRSQPFWWMKAYANDFPSLKKKKKTSTHTKQNKAASLIYLVQPHSRLWDLCCVQMWCRHSAL